MEFHHGWLMLSPIVILILLTIPSCKNYMSKSLQLLKAHSSILLTIAISSYLLWLTFVMIKSNTWFIGNETFDLWFPERIDTKKIAFWQSVASSTLDSTIFLILISSVIGLRGLRDPKEEDYKRKIQNLFPEVDMHSDMGQYLQKKISFLACISPCVQRIITIDQISECKKFIHISIQTDCDIKNIHHNHPFSDVLKYKVTLDKFELTEVDYLLKIIKMQVIKHRNGHDNKKNVLPHPVSIKNKDTNKTFDKELELDLQPYETATYLTHSLMWQDLSKPLNSSNVRYTIEQSYEIKNETGKDLFLKVNKPINPSLMDKIKKRFSINLEDKKEQLHTLKHDCTVEFSTGEVEPGEKVELNFSTSEFKHDKK